MQADPEATTEEPVGQFTLFPAWEEQHLATSK